MRILMGSILNMDEDMNGVVVTAKEQLEMLSRQHHDVRLISPYTIAPASLILFLIRKSSRLYQRTGASVFTLLNLSLKALNLARQTYKFRSNYDVMHAHDLISAMVFLGLNRSKNITLLNAHFHSRPWDEFVSGGYVKAQSMTYKILRALFTRALQSDTLKLMPVSQRNSKMLDIMASPDKRDSVVLYPGVESSLATIALTDQSPYIINVGALNSRKNQIELIDILAQLELLGVSIPLVLIGPEDPMEKQRILERMHELQLQTQVYFLGQQSSAETQRMIQAAHLYIHSANNESFGRTLIEAMSLKTPVVAVEYEAVHEILTKEGILPATWNVQRKAAYLKTLLANESLMGTLQSAQYHKYLEKFTAEQMISTYTTTLEGQWRYTS